MPVAASVWDTHFGALALRPWPRITGDRLQAWDGGDRLVDLLCQTAGHFGKLWVLNDQWGALSLAGIASGAQVTVTLDSACSRQALLANCSDSGLSGSQLRCLLPAEAPSQQPDLVIVRIPRSLSLLRYQLEQISRFCAEGTRVWLVGMDKHLPKRLSEQTDEFLQRAMLLPGRFKAHCIEGFSRPAQASPEQEKYWTSVPWAEQELHVGAWPGVFSRDRLDPGGRFLASVLDPVRADPNHRVIADLGCGNGLLGLAMARSQGPRTIWFADDSWWAVESARRNVRSNFGERLDARFSHGHGLADIARVVDTVLLNPPFHRGNAVDPAIGNALIADAASKLAPGGTLWLVANRHLDYRAGLKSGFSRWQQVAQNPKFRVLCAIR